MGYNGLQTMTGTRRDWTTICSPRTATAVKVVHPRPSDYLRGYSWYADYSLFVGECTESAVEGRVTRLTTLFRGLPKDMFVNKLISVYCSSEAKLEDIRLELFEYTKAFEEFPYGTQVELKKRLHTRSGDSVVTKLCKDIHILMSVIEGAEFSELTDVMSLPRATKSRSCQSVSQSCSPTQCTCAAEINALKTL